MKEIIKLYDTLYLCEVDIDELTEQDLNARYMSDEQFKSLTKIIEREKRLESLPLICKYNGKYYIVSGHHRIRACRASGVKTIYVLYESKILTLEEMRYKQLYHNSLSGRDDKQIIDMMIEEIDNKLLLLDLCIEDIKIDTFEEITDDLKIDKEESKKMLFIFLKNRYEQINDIISDIMQTIIIDNVDCSLVGADKTYNLIIDSIKKIKKETEIKYDKEIIYNVFKFVKEKKQDFIEYCKVVRDEKIN
jgi:uncharacterized ParB-like nuclease family protein